MVRKNKSILLFLVIIMLNHSIAQAVLLPAKQSYRTDMLVEFKKEDHLLLFVETCYAIDTTYNSPKLKTSSAHHPESCHTKQKHIYLSTIIARAELNSSFIIRGGWWQKKQQIHFEQYQTNKIAQYSFDNIEKTRISKKNHFYFASITLKPLHFFAFSTSLHYYNYKAQQINKKNSANNQTASKKSSDFHGIIYNATMHMQLQSDFKLFFGVGYHTSEKRSHTFPLISNPNSSCFNYTIGINALLYTPYSVIGSIEYLHTNADIPDNKALHFSKKFVAPIHTISFSIMHALREYSKNDIFYYNFNTIFSHTKNCYWRLRLGVLLSYNDWRCNFSLSLEHFFPFSFENSSSSMRTISCQRISATWGIGYVL